MSKRRSPGEVVRRLPGSGFTASEEPYYIRVPDEPEYTTESASCMYGCGDDDCREYTNVRIIGGVHDGEYMYHISECEMTDLKMDDITPRCTRGTIED